LISEDFLVKNEAFTVRHRRFGGCDAL